MRRHHSSTQIAPSARSPTWRRGRCSPHTTWWGVDDMTLTVERPATAAPPAPRPSAKDVIKLAKDAGVKIVDLRFVDLPGTWQHFSIPVFQTIDESDMLLVLDPVTAFIDPVLEVKTMDIVADVVDPITRKPYTR